MADPVEAAAAALAEADALVVAAGAGMGVDSGLPDFRGNEGFWNAYPPYRELGVSFVQMASPAGFVQDPPLAWGFYGHRRALYRRTVPHAGHGWLRDWGESRPAGGFVLTSNVDGQFQTAGFADDQIVEAHGSIHHDQCLRGCGQPLWVATGDVTVDTETMRAEEPLPACPSCGGLARPNVLMFGDGGWDPTRTSAQEQRLSAWLSSLGEGALTIVECGAGSAVPTVRAFSERLVRGLGARLVRINPREPEVPDGQIGIPAAAGETLAALAARLR
jgi:NAD-dependent SIR2 family protein deacetylase